MIETLVIRLASTASETAEWAVVDATGACVRAPEVGPLTAAAPLAAGRRTFVLTPACAILRTRADVPVRGAGKIAQALPYALEDLLADDLDDLHFAAGIRDADGKVPVAVVRRAFLDAWLAALTEAGIDAQGLFADSDGVADVPGTTTVLLEEHQAILRDPGGDAVVAETAGLTDLLVLWLAQSRPATIDGVLPPRNLQVYDATVDGWPTSTWEDLQHQVQSLEVRRLPDGALLRLAAAISTTPGVNLLQGSYARRSTLGAEWSRWRLAASLVAALGVAMLAALGADTLRLKRDEARLAQELIQAVSYTFPGTGDVDSARALVDQRLGGSGASSSPQFLETLDRVSTAVSRTGNAKLENLNYRAGVMELQIRAPSAEALDNISKLVSEGGRFKADIQSANAEGDEIQGRIRITRSGA